jgi:superoxide dismutase, Fe-Mn family
MATIIAGLFDTTERAERAARRVLGLGVPAERIDTFFNNPPVQHDVDRGGGVAGALVVEQTEGRWVDGRWADFDPLAPPVPASRVATTSSTHESSTAMKHELPPLPYPLHALEPHISSETLEYHHGKHHKLYVDKLNQLIKGTPFETASLEDIVRKSSGQLFNNAGQAWNHNFYWQCLSPDGGGSPSGEVARMIDQGFGGFEKFREKFSQSAETLFGSGWIWLVRNADGSLDIVTTGNAENPMRSGKAPLLACDVWEHAYYIDYRNARKDYVEAFWNVVNWDFVKRNLEPAHAYAHTRSS